MRQAKANEKILEIGKATRWCGLNCREATYSFLLLIKKITVLLLASGISLSDEQTEETPNIGSGLVEALGYIGGSMLVIWVL